jgi:hypothetical protein
MRSQFTRGEVETHCVDCGVKMMKMSSHHIRCVECRKKAKGRNLEERFAARFPVYNPDLLFLVKHLFEDTEEVMAKLAERESIRKINRLAKALQGPTPCMDCHWRGICSEEKLACRAFWDWSNAPNKKQGIWGRRTKPCGRYYDWCFPRDIKQTGMRRVV